MTEAIKKKPTKFTEAITALKLLEKRTKLLEKFVSIRFLGDLRKFIETLTDKELDYWFENHPQFKTMFINEKNWRQEIKQ